MSDLPDVPDKQEERKPNNGMDWESMARDAFDTVMLTAFGAAAASILLHTFKPELATLENDIQCGMAYALLAFSFTIRMNRR